MAEKLWGGRFTRPPAEDFEKYAESFSFDRRLAAAEVRGSLAHARQLAAAGVLSAAELRALEAGLARLAAAIAAGTEPAPGAAAEDVHTFVFQRLLESVGEAARKLQTGRSRNEQVALDLRLYILDQAPAWEQAFTGLLNAWADFAERHAEIIIPGFTHLQRAQPISLGHHALAYAEMLLRDRERWRQGLHRLAVSPLGSGALAGMPFAGDREAAARELRLAAISQNSLDAVGDRDFVAEIHFVAALTGLHLSRWAEDWILYSSSEFGWLRLDDAYTSGSSLMPQKKNPDALELLRGKSARLTGNLMQSLMLLKGLPLAYNRDLQEDKAPLFDSLDAALAGLRIAAGVTATAGVDAARCAAAAGDPVLLATDLADLLVAAGVPFHTAHAQVGQVMSQAAVQGTDFRQWPEAELQRLLPQLAPDKIRALSPAASVARRDGPGGAAPNQVRWQAARVRKLAAAVT